jgi:hypothetical protein
MGNWWYENGQLVGIPIWNMGGFDAIMGGLALDDPKFDQIPGEASKEQVKEIKKIAQKSGVNKIILSGPLVNSLSRIHGKDFGFGQEERKEYYSIFFKETYHQTNGYFIAEFPPTTYDPALFKVAKEWFPKL